MSYPQKWWTTELVSDLIVSIVTREWAHLRPGEPNLPTVAITINNETADKQRIEPDSLEIVHLATAVATFFQMHHVGIEDYLLTRRTLADWTNLVCQSLEQYNASIGFRTSGSTGVAKVCVHSIETLNSEAAYWTSLFGDRDLLVGVVPRHHIYGFIFTVLLPRMLEAKFIDGHGRTPSTLAHELTNQSVLIAYPDYWKIIRQAQVEFPASLIGITSTAPCPDSLAESLTPKPLESLYQIYGSSETGGIGWRTQASTAYTLLPHWQQYAADTLRRQQDETTYILQDKLDWTDLQHFFVKGRRDHAVQVGGINVYPNRVAQVLKNVPGVADVAVRPMNQDEGTRLKAFIVPTNMEDDIDELRSTLSIHIEKELSTVERPRSLTFGTQLPRNELGKAEDWPINSGEIRE